MRGREITKRSRKAAATNRALLVEIEHSFAPLIDKKANSIAALVSPANLYLEGCLIRHGCSVVQMERIDDLIIGGPRKVKAIEVTCVPFVLEDDGVPSTRGHSLYK